jgi:hypothetical protein
MAVAQMAETAILLRHEVSVLAQALGVVHGGIGAAQ